MNKALAKLVGINHIALEVGNLDEALAFYGRLFDFELRGRAPQMAFIDMGDQFLALSEGRKKSGLTISRHFGLVVDDRSTVRASAEDAGATILPGARPRLPRPLGATTSRWWNTATCNSARPTASLRHLELDPAKSEEALDQIRKEGHGALKAQHVRRVRPGFHRCRRGSPPDLAWRLGAAGVALAWPPAHPCDLASRRAASQRTLHRGLP